MQRDAGEFHSRFGGFWIDRHDAGALLAERVCDGRIRPEVGERIEHFMRDGYVIIPGAVSTA